MINAVRSSSGSPLPVRTRLSFEERLRLDLSGLRVHTDASAAESARSLGAKAYNVGKDIVFAASQYAPDTPVGRKLLLHEVAHAVAATSQGGPLALGRKDSQAETVADQVASGVSVSQGNLSASHQDGPAGSLVIRRQASEEANKSTDFYNALLSKDYRLGARYLAEMGEAERRAVLAALSSETRELLRNAAIGLDPSRASEAVTSIEKVETRSRPAKPSEASPKGGPSDAADQGPYVPVGLTYRVVGVVGGGAAPPGELPPNVASSIGGVFGSGGLSSAIVLGAPGTTPATIQPEKVTPWLPGVVAAPGTGLPRFVNPIPGAGAPGTPGVFTRFIGPESGEGFFDPSRFRGNELAPRFSQEAIGQEATQARLRAFEVFKRSNVSPSDLARLSKAMQSKGVAGLSAEELALLQKITKIHAEVAGATEASPLLSLTELSSEEALKRLPPVAAKRAYVVRVRINPEDVGRVNDILKRAGKSGEGLAGELEVVVAEDLAAGAKGTPEILSITANPAKAAPLGGWKGPALTWVGRGLVFIGAALTVKEVVTAEGPHRRETQGRAFGSFAGGTALGAFGAGLCIGLGVATAGAGILLCGLGFGLAGALGGGAIGGAIGRRLD